MSNAVLSLTMLVALVLLGGAYLSWRVTGDRRRAVLMVILAVIALANVALWTLPGPSGDTPLQKAEQLNR